MRIPPKNRKDCEICHLRPIAAVSYLQGALCAECNQSLDDWKGAYGLSLDVTWATRRAWHYARLDARHTALIKLLYGDETVTSEQFCNAEARIFAEARVAELEAPRWLYFNQGAALLWRGEVAGLAWPANGVYYACTLHPHYSFPNTFPDSKAAYAAVEQLTLGKLLFDVSAKQQEPK